MESVKFNGNEVHIAHALPEVGREAPDFVLVGRDLSEICLNGLKGSRVVLNIFPSVDTDVCAASVRRFNRDAAAYPDTKVLCVSMDLPFAAERFCAAEGIENVATASAFRSDFGRTYGVELQDGPLRGLFARALVVIDKDGKVLGTSLCEEITEEPDYDFVHNLLK